MKPNGIEMMLKIGSYSFNTIGINLLIYIPAHQYAS